MENKNLNGQPCPKTWMIESILVTLLCCLPLGIIGIINANKVEERFRFGDITGAQEASEKAKLFIMIGAIVGAISFIIAFVFGLFSSLFTM